LETYLVPAGFGEAEFTEKRSRFIGRVWRVESEVEAAARIDEMRKKHHDATHNVYAYILREGALMRYSDDGEPQGTSGMPALNVFRGQGIENVCCVVTRYFGGTLLGGGGLVRAYSLAAKMALEAAGVLQMAPWQQLSLACSYAQYERVMRLLRDFSAVIEGTDFGTDVLIDALLCEDVAAGFSAALTSLSQGSIEPLVICTQFRGVQIR